MGKTSDGMPAGGNESFLFSLQPQQEEKGTGRRERKYLQTEVWRVRRENKRGDGWMEGRKQKGKDKTRKRKKEERGGREEKEIPEVRREQDGKKTEGGRVKRRLR